MKHLTKCEELFNYNLIVHYTENDETYTPIRNLADRLDDEAYSWLNDELKNILIEEKNKGTEIIFLMKLQKLMPLLLAQQYYQIYLQKKI